MSNYWHSTKRTPAKVRWVGTLLVAMLIFECVGFGAFLAGNRMAAFFFAQILAGVCLGASLEIMFHGTLLTTAILLAPFGLALYGVHRNVDVWRKWQFWIISMACAIVGGYIIICLTRIYRSREQK
jgi:hypothetical protein